MSIETLVMNTILFMGINGKLKSFPSGGIFHVDAKQ